ncbi:Aflatoxin biosynthesis regulatory protein [Cytospora mali]|uniref:Aflatoxin biosynthesis regulatory protein n=1 Tax=Cytospora mali TaxID=578113 RepID=A0A194W6S8_CYTMA|nr:Aflatoxin biosynthesis regulatory protein [Valsa mali]
MENLEHQQPKPSPGATGGNTHGGNLSHRPPDMSARQHEPLTPRSRTRQIQSKLRSSCDACGQAKIKCDRGQPSCARCVAQGITCVYGISRKAGKPPRKRPAAPASLPPPSGLPSRSVEPETATTGIDLHGGGSGSGGGNFDGIDIDMMLGLGEGCAAIDSPFSTSDAAFQSWFHFDTFGSLGTLPPSSSDWDACMAGHGDPILDPVESPATSTSSTSASTASTSATSTSSTVAVATEPRHNCTQETKEIMRRLYCANPSTPISDGLPARTLDLGSVLTRTGEVVRPLEVLLKCPCARSPHMAMLYASIMSRMLLWYRQAVWDASSARESSLASSFKPTMTAEETMHSLSGSAMVKALEAEAADDTTGVSVPPMPVMVGSFQSDDRNVQTALISCLILSELRRVGALIDSFISLGTDATGLHTADNACSAAGDPSTGVADGSLFASLGAWLRNEHGNIVMQARSGLSTLG